MNSKSRNPHALQAGMLIIEADVARLILQESFDVLPLLRRHLVDDWGDISASERRQNVCAIVNGGEIFSNYRLSPLTSLWIVSEWDRSVTTLLLPPSPPEQSGDPHDLASDHVSF